MRSAFPTLLGLLLLAACDSSSNVQKRPRLKVTTQAVTEQPTVVEGDTVIFRPVEPEKAPCHFFKPSCDLPPIPVEGLAGSIHLRKGYFLIPVGDVPLQGEVTHEKNEIEVRIWPDFEAGGDTHPDIVVPVIYEAWVQDLSPGTYQVRVVHEHDALRAARGSDDSDSRAIVAEQQVTVN